MWLVIQGKLGGKLGKNYLILERLVGETFMNQWKNIYPCQIPKSSSSKSHFYSNKEMDNPGGSGKLVGYTF